jgi:hypothetical protein
MLWHSELYNNHASNYVALRDFGLFNDSLLAVEVPVQTSAIYCHAFIHCAR